MALLLAFVGGMVLNLMPCVFPVLSIKLLGLAKQAAEPAALRTHALAYGGGVLLSFLALALGLIALQAAGSAVGWGFQLQEPGMVFVLALLFFAIGLNLMGVLRVRQPAAAARRPPGARSARPATPSPAACWRWWRPAPAPRRSWARRWVMRMTQSPAVALAVFAALGLGMALPYMAADAVAGLAPPPAAARPVDGTAEAGPGLPDVRHRGVAAVGAGPAGRRRRDGPAC